MLSLFGAEQRFYAGQKMTITSGEAVILMDAGISCISRVGTDHTIFTKACSNLRKGLESKDNLVKPYGRVYFIIETRVKIGKNKDRYAYGYFALIQRCETKVEKGSIGS